jgi:hypothetical protein
VIRIHSCRSRGQSQFGSAERSGSDYGNCRRAVRVITTVIGRGQVLDVSSGASAGHESFGLAVRQTSLLNPKDLRCRFAVQYGFSKQSFFYHHEQLSILLNDNHVIFP